MHKALVADRTRSSMRRSRRCRRCTRRRGWTMRDSIIAERGFDWDALPAPGRTRNRSASLYGLDDEQVERVVLAVAARARRSLAEGADGLGATDDERRAAAILLAGILEDGAVAEAFWAESGRRVLSPRSPASPTS